MPKWLQNAEWLPGAPKLNDGERGLPLSMSSIYQEYLLWHIKVKSMAFLNYMTSLCQANQRHIVGIYKAYVRHISAYHISKKIFNIYLNTSLAALKHLPYPCVLWTTFGKWWKIMSKMVATNVVASLTAAECNDAVCANISRMLFWTLGLPSCLVFKGSFLVKITRISSVLWDWPVVYSNNHIQPDVSYVRFSCGKDWVFSIIFRFTNCCPILFLTKLFFSTRLFSDMSPPA